MKHGRRKLQLERTTIRPLTPEQLASVAGGGDAAPDTYFCPVRNSLTGHYSVKPCPYSGDCP
jgi:hypothetical protein